jgi:hypothetical protein
VDLISLFTRIFFHSVLFVFYSFFLRSRSERKIFFQLTFVYCFIMKESPIFEAGPPCALPAQGGHHPFAWGSIPRLIAEAG